MSSLRRSRYCIPILLLVMAAFMVSCGSSNPQAPFDADKGRHSVNWSNPLSVGADDFHATMMREVQSSSNGAVLFSKRCALCHGGNAAGKIGADIRGVGVPEITNAINVIPLMKGQAGLTPGDIQDIADYIATLRAGAAPVAVVVNTRDCLACHGGDLSGGIAAVSCFSCHNGPDGSIGHPTRWILPSSGRTEFHGNYGRKYSASCTNCHGVDFRGGIGGPCTFCHNGGIAPVLDFIPAPPPAGTGITITTSLNGSQEVPAVVTPASGTANLTVNTDTREISGTLTFSGLSANATAAHIHQGAAGVNGPVIIPLSGGVGGTSGTWTIPAGTVLTVDQFNLLRINGLYFNVHSTANPGGEIRGQIIFSGISIATSLNGAQEVPAVVTPASGTANLTVNADTRAISGTLTFSGLSANATAAHIHQGAAGTNGPVIIPLTGGAGGTSGTWTIPAGTFLTIDQFNALRTNGLYFNVHSTANPGGEIRGQIVFTGVSLTTSLGGGQEVPPVTTAATGTAVMTVNMNTGAISGTLTFSGFSTNATAAHIHQGAAGVNGPVIIPLTGGAGGTSGTWTIPAGSVLNAEQLAALNAGGLYFNVHSTANPGGEIRGQIQ